jgi:hypothetical protein
MFFLRSSVIETWLMSKSNAFAPGAITLLKLATVQVTSVVAKPSLSATA